MQRSADCAGVVGHLGTTGAATGGGGRLPCTASVCSRSLCARPVSVQVAARPTCCCLKEAFMRWNYAICTGLKRDDSTQTIPAVWGAPPAAVSPAASAACSCTPLWSCPQVATPCLQHIQQHRCVPHRIHQQRHCSKQQLTADHTMQGAHAHSTPPSLVSLCGGNTCMCMLTAVLPKPGDATARNAAVQLLPPHVPLGGRPHPPESGTLDPNPTITNCGLVGWTPLPLIDRIPATSRYVSAARLKQSAAPDSTTSLLGLHPPTSSGGVNPSSGWHRHTQAQTCNTRRRLGMSVIGNLWPQRSGSAANLWYK